MTKNTFTVAEQIVVSKTGNEDICEDAIIVNENFAAVIDGATSKSDFYWDGKTSGQAAKDILKKSIELLPPDCNAYEAVAHLTRSVASVYRLYGNEKKVEKDPNQRITASIAIYSSRAREVWLVGDCQALIGEKLFSNDKLIDDIFTSARAAVLEIELAEGASIANLLKTDPGRLFIYPLLKRQGILQNNPVIKELWYPVIDGFKVPESGIKILKVPIDVSYIVIATDGYPLLRKNLAESEAELHYLIEQDPLMFRLFKTTKGVNPGDVSFDDRAYLKLYIK